MDLTLVTGAPGWLGTRLVEHLHNKGRKVRCLVWKGVNRSVLEKSDVEFVEGDIRDKNSLNNIMKNVTAVFHCVGIIHPGKIRDLYEVNYEGTKNLLELASKEKIKKFIYVSSNSPAGTNNNPSVLLKETDKPNPYKHYGKSKLLAEQAVSEYFQSGKLNTVIIRPCWFYGINQPERQTRFFRMIKSGKPIIFGDGENLRSMSYIDNIIQGLLLAEENDKANGQIYWIADRRPYKTIEIYETIAGLLGVKLTPKFIPKFASNICELADDLLQFVGMYVTEFHVAGEMTKNIACSIEKAEKELGYKPEIELEEGMRRSIEWCRANGFEI